MNAKIKQLLKTAQERYPRALNSGDPEITLTLDAFELFAKSIAQECADIAYDYDVPKMSGHGMVIGVRIEQQFGVEE